MNKLGAILISGLFALLLAACGGDAPAPTATPTQAASVSQPKEAPTSPPDTPTPAPTSTTAPTKALDPTNTPAPTEAPAPTVAPVPTDTPEPSPTPVAEDTPTPEPTATPEPTSTPTPTATPEPASTSTPTPTPTPEPDKPPIAVTLAPLGDNLIWVAHYDNATQGWSTYDPIGTLTPDELPLPPGGSVPDPSAIGSLTELITGKIYWIMAGKEQTVQLGSQDLNIKSGLNFLGWK